ncbi:MAG TPA: DUF1207 domain-containing protein, partial [Anaeromyxobacter sp.]|nr:DUF1207 domain-containing protein [Anaeromyxobacter sp.]
PCRRPGAADDAEATMLTSRSLQRLIAAVTFALTVGATSSPRAAELVPPEAFVLRCGTGVHAGEGAGFVLFPQGGVFCPLLADPKQTRSFASYLRGEFPRVTGAKNVGSVGVGDGVRFFRYGWREPGEGIQLGLEAAVFTQFDLGTRSADLMNADYILGLPLTFRVAGFSGRVRVYHQSSHLGDELVAHSRTEITNAQLSFEAVEMILSQEVWPLRIYAGGDYLFHRTPSALEAYVAHGGVELRLGPARGARFVAALDVKASQQRDWKPAYSVRSGVEIAYWHHPDHPPRTWEIVGEYYEGPSPYGQFFLDQTRFYGFGFHFQL